MAVRNFSAWLLDQVKTDNNVDIVLLGHSMGGIVGKERATEDIGVLTSTHALT